MISVLMQSTNVGNLLLNNAAASAIDYHVTESPPFPRAQIDHKTLTRPVPVRGTPITVSQISPSITPELRAAAFSPQGSFYSAFKPVQSPTLNELSESPMTKSITETYGTRSALKFRHSARNFFINPHNMISAPQLHLECSIDMWGHNNNNNLLTPSIPAAPNTSHLRRVKSHSDISVHYYSTYNCVTNQARYLKWFGDGHSSCGNYSDIDVEEIEVN